MTEEKKNHEHKKSKEETHEKNHEEKQTKHKKKKNLFQQPFFWTTAILIVLIAVVVVQNFPLQSKGEVAAIVNGEKIYMAELDYQYESIPDVYKQYMSKEDLLDRMINSLVVYQTAVKEGYTAENLDKLIEEMYRPLSYEEFIQQLELSGINYDQFKSDLAESVIVQEYLVDNVDELKVSDEELQMAYEDYNDYVSRDSFRASHILVNTTEEAEAVLERINYGEDFAEVAKEVSVDTASAVNGGDLGWFSEGDMVESFENAVKALSVGEVSEPVESQFGYHIVKLYDKKQGEGVSFDDAKPYLVFQMFAQKVQENSQAYLDYVAELRKSAEVEVVYYDDDNVIEISSLEELQEKIGEIAAERANQTESGSEDDAVTTTMQGQATTTLATTTTMAAESVDCENEMVYFYYISGAPSSESVGETVDSMIADGKPLKKIDFLDEAQKKEIECYGAATDVFPALICGKNGEMRSGPATEEEINNFISSCLS